MKRSVTAANPPKGCGRFSGFSLPKRWPRLWSSRHFWSMGLRLSPLHLGQHRRPGKSRASRMLRRPPVVAVALPPNATALRLTPVNAECLPPAAAARNPRPIPSPPAQPAAGSACSPDGAIVESGRVGWMLRPTIPDSIAFHPYMDSSW